jgi:hypothetical protein
MQVITLGDKRTARRGGIDCDHADSGGSSPLLIVDDGPQDVDTQERRKVSQRTMREEFGVLPVRLERTYELNASERLSAKTPLCS